MEKQVSVFSLAEVNASLVHKNERLELHGEDSKLACDLNFVLETSNAALAMFAPALRGCIYQRAQGPQTELPGTDDPDHTPSLRFPALSTLKWGAGELIGAELRFHFGTTPKSHVVFDEAKVGKYKLECKEGGTVIISFQAQVYPTEQQSGKLSKFLQDKACVISITPPGEKDKPGE